jgi:hypothetical protein
MLRAAQLRLAFAQAALLAPVFAPALLAPHARHVFFRCGPASVTHSQSWQAAAPPPEPRAWRCAMPFHGPPLLSFSCPLVRPRPLKRRPARRLPAGRWRGPAPAPGLERRRVVAGESKERPPGQPLLHPRAFASGPQIPAAPACSLHTCQRGWVFPLRRAQMTHFFSCHVACAPRPPAPCHCCWFLGPGPSPAGPDRSTLTTHAGPPAGQPRGARLRLLGQPGFAAKSLAAHLGPPSGASTQPACERGALPVVLSII